MTLGRVILALVGLAAACGAPDPAAQVPANHAQLAVAAEPPKVPRRGGAPAHAAVAKVARRPVRVLVAGDVLPHRPQLVDPPRVAEALWPLSPLFASADVAVANYETATGDPSGMVPHTFTLAATPEWMRALHDAGLHALTVANNHTCDLGGRGLRATLAAADATGTTALGAAADDPWKARVLVDTPGFRVCAVAWTTFSNERRSACASSAELAVATPDRRGQLKAALGIARAFHAGCDATIAIFHGGEEYLPQTAAMLGLARAVAEAGASAVVIHHPHVVSPLQVVTTEDGRRVPVFASVGNLVSNQGESWTPRFPARQQDRHVVYLNGWTRLGMIADLSWSFDDAGKPALAWGYHLVWTDNEHVLDRSNPHPRIAARLVDPDADGEILRKLAKDGTGPREVFDGACWLREPGSRPACH